MSIAQRGDFMWSDVDVGRRSGRSRRRWPRPPFNLNTTPDYRRHLGRVLVRRALEEAGTK